jgi:formylglycine-generating enzyme required for sulfatase activity
MVRTTSFYADSTEVTSAQYALFLAAKSAKLGEQAAECSWNMSFEPDFVQGQPMARPNQPVTNVDWCDAAAYCAWADKQLRGKIGGGELQLADLADPSKSQWYLACAGHSPMPMASRSKVEPVTTARAKTRARGRRPIRQMSGLFLRFVRHVGQRARVDGGLR